MLFFYQIGIKLYVLLIKISSLFNSKAKLWLKGRKKVLQSIHSDIYPFQSYAWFHFASLGEFEQGVPVLQLIKENKPEYKIIITFFSPSGYEARKNSKLADHVYYLPVDTPENAREFVRMIDPKLAVFTKYEYWYYYFKELHDKKIPLYIISGIFRKQQNYFKWYGGLNRKTLAFVDHFFVQDIESKQLLASLNYTNVTVSGDTRFDRVAENASSPKKFPLIEAFCGSKTIGIAGSTWPVDEKLIVDLVKNYPEWKFIIAPHEIAENRITDLINSLPTGKTVRYSAFLNDFKKPVIHSKPEDIELDAAIRNTPYSILIIDNIGMLSSLYQYGHVAYIGGGFGAGIHNTLEAAVFGLPLIFGPKYQKFREAIDLIALNAAFPVSDAREMLASFVYLQDNQKLAECGNAAKKYVYSHTGASSLIIDHLLEHDI